MLRILKQIVRTGIVTEPLPVIDWPEAAAVQAIHQDLLNILEIGRHTSELQSPAMI
jgi:hypothetical protein